MGLQNLSGGYNHCTECYSSAPFKDFVMKALRNAVMTKRIVESWEWRRPLFKDMNPAATTSYAGSYDGANNLATTLFRATGHLVSVVVADTRSERYPLELLSASWTVWDLIIICPQPYLDYTSVQYYSVTGGPE